MSRSIPRLLSRVRKLAEQGRVNFTRKAYRELATFDQPIVESDAIDIIIAFTEHDFVQRIKSHITGEHMYVFKTRIGNLWIYVKLLLRDECIIVSFHEDTEDHA